MMEERGAWQKVFVSKLVEQGVPHDHAMAAMALAAEERQIAYMQGNAKGYNDGYDDVLLARQRRIGC